MARSFILFILLGVSGTAFAQYKQPPGFRYSFIEGSYSKATYDNLARDGDGLGVSASIAVSDHFHVFGGYAGADLGDSVDADGWYAGIGLNVPLTQLLDAVVQGSYQSNEVKLPTGGSIDDDGFGLRAGVRVGANEWIEVNGGVSYTDLDSGNETTLDAGFLLNISDAFAVGVSGAWDDDVSVWSINGRLYFE